MSLRCIVPGLACAGLLGLAAPGHVHADPPQAISVVAGVPWETSFAAARARARREDKPILLLHLFGRLDRDLC